ncbi:MAG: AAA family ATPase [Acidobacteriota bacterium]|jgi:chromosome partitioning protein
MTQPAKIVVCGGEKGGTGKSTVATEFACILAGQGKKVLLVDADDQQTATKFTRVRTEDQPDAPQYTCIQLRDKSVRAETLKLKDAYDHIIIDTGGRDTTSQRAGLSIAQIMLAPFAPRDFDLDTLDKVETIVSEIQNINPELQAFSFINHADPAGQGTENTDAVGRLRRREILQYLEAPIGRRKAFSHASSLGLAVTELRRPYRDQKAIDEIMTLFTYCFNVKHISISRPQESVL